MERSRSGSAGAIHADRGDGVDRRGVSRSQRNAAIAWAAPGRSGQISHVVLFWLKRPGNVDDQNVLLRAARSFRRIKGVSDVRVGRSLPVARPVEQSFDIGLVITFKDAGALKKFERNQRHQQVVEAALRPLVRRYIVYNFSNE